MADRARTAARELRNTARALRKERRDGGATRRRDAEATRQALLEAAKNRFGRAGYDRVALRDIAAQAGVDVALIGRYFGSKEALFTAAITPASHPRIEFPEDRGTFGEWMARRIFSPRPDVARLLIAHHGAANTKAAAIVRGLIRERLIEPLAQWIGGEDGNLRASLLASHLAGIRLIRDVAGLEELTEADQETFVRLLAPALQAYIDG